MLAQELGADEAIDYTSSGFEEVLKSHPVDVVIDPMAGAAPQIVSSHVAMRSRRRASPRCLYLSLAVFWMCDQRANAPMDACAANHLYYA